LNVLLQAMVTLNQCLPNVVTPSTLESMIGSSDMEFVKDEESKGKN